MTLRQLIARGSEKTPTELHLKIELVPEPLWGKNLRSEKVLGRYRWRKLRKGLIEERGLNCSVCGSTDRPHAHEVWRYDEGKRAGKATLVGIEIVCWKCHYVHHFGVATRLWEFEGRISDSEMAAIKKHFRQVNGCKAADFTRHYGEAYEIWEAQSEKKWTVS